ncbi:hypothetical protein F2Q69_00017312 [Brassica cretica]|uniref:Uncharacterized protein n=1 Tax=Brassica cretica TaxID=69181 RepID=A0A8S9R5J0_BRACR|nr:hypothetical protein F2Q69_00017312 [Brassica cretica]
MIASSLSYPSRPHRRRRRSFYLPCPLYVDSLLESYSTINIFASDNNHLWIYRKKLSGFLVKISDNNKLYRPETLLLYLRSYDVVRLQVWIRQGTKGFRAPEDGKSNYLGLFLAEITCAGFLQTCGQHEDHEEFKVKINVLVETAPTVPEEVFLGNKGLNDVENYELPRLVYVLVRREPRSDHHKKVEEINLLYSVEDMTLWGSIKWS